MTCGAPRITTRLIAVALVILLALAVAYADVAGAAPANGRSDRDTLADEAIGLMIENSGGGQAEALLGILYLRGMHIESDPVAAAAWLERAAAANHPAGLYAAARMYSEGLGVPRNPERARKLLSQIELAAFGELVPVVTQLRLALDMTEPAGKAVTVAHKAEKTAEKTTDKIADKSGEKPAPAVIEAALPAPAVSIAPVSASPVSAPVQLASVATSSASTLSPVGSAMAATMTAAPPVPPAPPVERPAVEHTPQAAPSAPVPVVVTPPELPVEPSVTPAVIVSAPVAPVAVPAAPPSPALSRSAVVSTTVRNPITPTAATLAPSPAPTPASGLSRRSQATTSATMVTPVVSTLFPSVPAPVGQYAQIATVFTEEAAARERNRILAALPGEIAAGREVMVRPLRAADGRATWLILVAGFANRGEARSFCEHAVAVKLGCLVKG